MACNYVPGCQYILQEKECAFMKMSEIECDDFLFEAQCNRFLPHCFWHFGMCMQQEGELPNIELEWTQFGYILPGLKKTKPIPGAFQNQAKESMSTATTSP